MKSPCIKVCKVKGSYCLGCGRSLEQIKNWTRYTALEREKIIKAIKNGK